MTPKPKSEIVITPIHSVSVRVLFIYCASSDANEWVIQHAPQFGKLEIEPERNRWRMEVSPLYDFDEVQTFIARQGAE